MSLHRLRGRVRSISVQYSFKNHACREFASTTVLRSSVCRVPIRSIPYSHVPNRIHDIHNKAEHVLAQPSGFTAQRALHRAVTFVICGMRVGNPALAQVVSDLGTRQSGARMPGMSASACRFASSNIGIAANYRHSLVRFSALPAVAHPPIASRPGVPESRQRVQCPRQRSLFRAQPCRPCARAAG